MSLGTRTAARSDDLASAMVADETPAVAPGAWPAAKALAASAVVFTHAADGDKPFASGGRTAGRFAPRRASRSRSRSLARRSRLWKRSQRASKPLRGLLVRQTFEVAEHEGGPINLRQRVDLDVDVTGRVEGNGCFDLSRSHFGPPALMLDGAGHRRVGRGPQPGGPRHRASLQPIRVGEPIERDEPGRGRQPVRRPRHRARNRVRSGIPA